MANLCQKQHIKFSKSEKITWYDFSYIITIIIEHIIVQIKELTDNSWQFVFLIIHPNLFFMVTLRQILKAEKLLQPFSPFQVVGCKAIMSS